MLSRLIITFLCAATIGSVSSAFLTFEPDPVVFKDADISTSVSVRLNSKPTEEVTVYFEGPTMSMSTCMIVFSPDNWDVPHPIRVMPVSPPFDTPDLLVQPESNSELLAKAVTAGPLPADLSSTDSLKITQASKALSNCIISGSTIHTFDELYFSFSKPDWYQVMSTGDIEIQILRGECTFWQSCFTAIVFRYGPTVMSLDTRGPIKNVDEYPMTHVTPNTNGLRYTLGPEVGEHRIVFPCGSKLSIAVVDNNGIVNLNVFLLLVAGYTSPRGFCNIPRPRSSHNRLIGSDGQLHNDMGEADAFANSWEIKDEDVLTNPDARALIPPLQQQPGTVCTFPENSLPKPVLPTPSIPPSLTSTLSPTITYVLSSTTITTSPSTTPTTSPPPPAPPQPDVVGEI
ncbi:hypothetical protein BASA81_010720 [Batrachochytrium salamandrivorans]|nr:hypothetical protein BASA81_010720 [Batrachochytrium salamandrivorans]